MQHGASAVNVSLEIAHLHLQQSKVSLDRLGFGFDPQCKPIRLDRLFVVLFGTIKQTVHMPADMRFHIVLQSFLGQHKGLFLLSLVADDQCLHRQCVAMIRVLPQDLICCFDTCLSRENETSVIKTYSHCKRTGGEVSGLENPKPTLLVLFGFIVANHLAEQGRILGTQLLRHDGCCAASLVVLRGPARLTCAWKLDVGGRGLSPMTRSSNLRATTETANHRHNPLFIYTSVS